MAEINNVITFLIASRPGITDRELCDAIYGEAFLTAFIAGRCRDLEMMGKITRRRRFIHASFAMGNYPKPELRIDRAENFHNIVISVGE